MASELTLAADLVSAVAALILVYATWRPCHSSGVQYLLGMPAGFALIAVGFLANIPTLTNISGASSTLFITISMLTQMYGLLFIALTYARRTRLTIIGESIILEIVIPVVITVGVVTYALISVQSSTGEVMLMIGRTLRIVMALATLYPLYETERNWSFTQRASEGVVTVAFGFLFVEQLGFLLTSENWGIVATFVAYEGRLLGLTILIALTRFGTKKRDFAIVLKRLGLTALAH